MSSSSHQDTYTSVPCNLCGADDHRLVYERERAAGDFERAEAQMTTDVYGAYGRIVQCRRCGFIYMNPQLSAAHVLSAYSSMEDVDYQAEDDCRSINAHLSMKVVNAHKKGGRLLDVGCSVGYLLNAARLHFDPVGVEPSRWAVDYATSKLNLQVVQGTLAEANFEPAFFDVVTMVDVIEHVTDPKATLIHAARILKPGGLLYLVTPDIGSLSARIMRGHWWGLRPAHLTYFSKKTMAAMLAETGFSIVRSASYGRIFTYGYWLSRIKNYPSLFYQTARFVISALGLKDKVVYLDTRDSMEICAIRSK